MAIVASMREAAAIVLFMAFVSAGYAYPHGGFVPVGGRQIIQKPAVLSKNAR
jgi:hypothetical protein